MTTALWLCVAVAISMAKQVVRFEPLRRKDLVGPQGATLREIEEAFGCSLDLTVEGEVKIFCEDSRRALEAKQLVQELVAEVRGGGGIIGGSSRRVI